MTSIKLNPKILYFLAMWNKICNFEAKCPDKDKNELVQTFIPTFFCKSV